MLITCSRENPEQTGSGDVPGSGQGRSLPNMNRCGEIAQSKVFRRMETAGYHPVMQI